MRPVSHLTPEPESRDRRDEFSYEVDREYEPYEPSDWGPIKPEPRFRILRMLAAPFIAFGLLFWKFKFILAAIFKFKIFTTSASMLVSLAAYAWIWGWKFGVGFIALLFVHELGHYLEARRQGLDVGAPVFIPFLGAAILLKENPLNSWRAASPASSSTSSTSYQWCRLTAAASRRRSTRTSGSWASSRSWHSCSSRRTR